LQIITGHQTPPPDTTPLQAQNQFNDQLQDYLSILNETNCGCYVFSDSNINLFKLTHDTFSDSYFNNLLLNGFVQTIFKSTRIQGASYGLIDHIITNTLPTNLTSGVVINDISDHFPTFIVHCDILKNSAPEFIVKRDFGLQNLENFKNDLSLTNWNPVLNNDNADQSYDIFWDIFSKAYESNFPLRRIKRNKNIHKINNFMTQGLLISRRTKNLLHKASIENPSNFNITYYKNYRNLYNKLIRNCKSLYYEQELNQCKSKPSKTWDLMKEAMNMQKTLVSIPDIVVDNQILTNDKDKANAFNTFFTDIGMQINQSILPTKRNPENFTPFNENPPPFEIGNIGPIYVSDVIKNLPSKSSNDLNGVSLKLTKFVRTQICVPLAHVFNLSVENGLFPKSLKCSRTVPVFKSGQASRCDNYRPISLVPTFSKILEKIVAVKLTNHLDLNNLLYKHQYGFQRGKQTEHNLIHLLNYVSNAINDNKYCMGVFLDIKKAFDCVQHDILFSKLHKLGIRGTSLQWFKSYLSQRLQKVDINGTTSGVKNIDIGVLQGSTLGPILFLCFINDFPMSTNLFSLLFADDTACLASGASLPELFDFVNTELQKVALWFKSNKLAVNVNKTKYIIFHTRQKKIDIGNLKLNFNSNDLNTVPDPDLVTELHRISSSDVNPENRTYKYLGILLDENLTFETHLNYLGGKISKSLYFISKVKNILPRKALLSLYFALIHPHLLYCTNIFSCATLSSIKKLEVLQKSAVRVISLKARNFPTKELFLQYGILPLRCLIDYQKANFMHSVFYEYCPRTFNDIFTKTRPIHDHDLRNINNFNTPRPKTDWYKRMPPFSFTSKWNALEEAKLYPNRVTFQIMLKGRLLENYALLN